MNLTKYGFNDLNETEEDSWPDPSVLLNGECINMLIPDYVQIFFNPFSLIYQICKEISLTTLFDK